MAKSIEVFSKGTIWREVVLIFLSVGNWHKGFDRLVEAVDELKGSNAISDEITAQIGSGSYKPVNLKVVDYCSPAEFTDFIAESRIVIAHSGIGTIAQAVELGKPVIVVPRKASLGEHVNDHQFSTARTLEKEGKILVAYEVCELSDKLKQAERFAPAKGKGAQEIVGIVEEFLEELAIRKARRVK